MLILIILTWSTISFSDGYADIGYKSGFNIEVAMNVTGPFYMRAELGDLVNSYGFGLGYDFNPVNVIFTADRIGNNIFEYGAQVAYYDIGWSYFLDFSYKSTKELGYKVGIGWSYNEKVSLLVYHSDNSSFFGLRRLF